MPPRNNNNNNNSSRRNARNANAADDSQGDTTGRQDTPSTPSAARGAAAVPPHGGTTAGQSNNPIPPIGTDTTPPAAANDATSSTQTSSLINPPPEVAEATKMLNDMKATLDPLISVFDTIAEKAGQVAVLTEDTEIAKKIKKLQDDMKAQDEKHAKGIKEINDMIDDLLNVQIVAQLESEVEKIIEAEIDEMVKLQVAEDLKKHIPQEQQEELAKVKRELEEVQRALHNSESRRANSELRHDDPDAVLHTIVRPDGQVSPLFPTDWKALFSLDKATCETLLLEYGQAGLSDSREQNLNRFIMLCGVSYQVSTNQLEDTVSYRSPIAVHHNYGSLF